MKIIKHLPLDSTKLSNIATPQAPSIKKSIKERLSDKIASLSSRRVNKAHTEFLERELVAARERETILSETIEKYEIQVKEYRLQVENLVCDLEESRERENETWEYRERQEEDHQISKDNWAESIDELKESLAVAKYEKASDVVINQQLQIEELKIDKQSEFYRAQDLSQRFYILESKALAVEEAFSKVKVDYKTTSEKLSTSMDSGISLLSKVGILEGELRRYKEVELQGCRVESKDTEV
jgi:hypothetical protein